MDGGCDPRQVGQKGTLWKNDGREHGKRRPVSAPLGRKWREKMIPDVEALGRQSLDIRRQLHRATQIIVAKYNDLQKLDMGKETLEQPCN